MPYDNDDQTTTAPDAVTADQTGFASGAYQELKSRIHQDLLNRLNLDRLAQVSREDGGTRDSVAHRQHARSRDRRRRRSARSSARALITDVLQRTVRPRAARGAAAATRTISDILVNRFDQVYIERERPARRDRHRLQRRPAPAADHRAHRQLGRPPHRRIEPDGRCAAARTARASTRSFRRWRSTARRCRSGVSGPIVWAPRTSSTASR